MKAYLGLDTSCYTTSVAIVDDQGRIWAAERRLLSVPEGGRGLRQQEMVFQHVAALPDLFETAMAKLPKDARLVSIAASTRPRDVQGSYMPAFTVGEGFARALSAALHMPWAATDHQAGHIAAARLESGLSSAAHLALHLSGGTTELLACDGASILKIGGTSDISAGQLVDRVGVALGLPFPAGPSLEALARLGLGNGAAAPRHLGVSMRGAQCSLSGAEAQAMRDIGAGKAPGEVALAVYSLLARLAARLLALGREQTGLNEALLAGGVASSGLFRDMLETRLEKERVGVRACFALPELSGDNAVGVALIARALLPGK